MNLVTAFVAIAFFSIFMLALIIPELIKYRTKFKIGDIITKNDNDPFNPEYYVVLDIKLNEVNTEYIQVAKCDKDVTLPSTFISSYTSSYFREYKVVGHKNL